MTMNYLKKEEMFEMPESLIEVGRPNLFSAYESTLEEFLKTDEHFKDIVQKVSENQNKKLPHQKIHIAI